MQGGAARCRYRILNQELEHNGYLQRPGLLPIAEVALAGKAGKATRMVCLRAPNNPNAASIQPSEHAPWRNAGEMFQRRVMPQIIKS